MGFSYGFFNAKNLDRVYTAENFTEYLSSLICDGIIDTFGDCFEVKYKSGREITIGTGKAWIKGHYFTNDTLYVLDMLSYVDSSLNRYATITICCDVSDNVRDCHIEVIPGTPSAQPEPTFPENTESKTYLTLATVFLSASSVNPIQQNKITDHREDNEKCGYCKCILGKCKVLELMAEIAQLKGMIQGYNTEIEILINKVDGLQVKVDDLTGDIVELGQIGEDIYYVLYSNGTLLFRGTGATYDYDIGRSPFYKNESIKKLVISDGITTIGSNLFEQCKNMTSASFPITLKEIKERAFFMFNDGGLTSLIIPKSVITIGEKAFACEALDSVTLPATIKKLGDNLFLDASHLTSARIECEEVPAYCFVRTPLKNLTLSHNVKKLGDHMINYTPLTEINYEGSIEDWGNVKKGTNWDNHTGANNPHGLDKVICLDGYMEYDRDQKKWKKVKNNA